MQVAADSEIQIEASHTELPILARAVTPTAPRFDPNTVITWFKVWGSVFVGV